MLTRIWDALQEPHDDHDKTLQYLMKGFGTEHFELAMYHALASYARALGDAETAQLALEHLRQEQQAADRLGPLIAPLAARAAGAAVQGPEPVAVVEVSREPSE
jgi:rubrerythrin